MTDGVDRTCPDCGRVADAVLDVQSVGTGTTALAGTVHLQARSDANANWRLFVHAAD